MISHLAKKPIVRSSNSKVGNEPVLMSDFNFSNKEQPRVNSKTGKRKGYVSVNSNKRLSTDGMRLSPFQSKLIIENVEDDLSMYK